MPRTAGLLRADLWRPTAERQEGLISSRQLRDLGLTGDQARQWVRTGRWRRLHHGVYEAWPVSGLPGEPATERRRIWAALLHYGPQAVAWGPTALWLHGAIDDLGPTVHVGLPNASRPVVLDGSRVHRSRHLSVHPVALPPRCRIEEALLDACDDAATPERAVDLTLRVLQRRLSTTGRLSTALGRRSRNRRRSLLADLLGEFETGVTSQLERRYARDVEHRHGLPLAIRNRRTPRPDRRGAHWYADARYDGLCLVVELDGRVAHPAESAFRDMARDNANALTGETTLRFGWRDIAGRPCDVAVQVVAGLRLGGWSGHPCACSPACPVGRADTEVVRGATDTENHLDPRVEGQGQPVR